MKKCSGFTLVEVAIVLVIIGLVVGGVVGGKEMIHTANIQKTARMLTDLDAALAAFKLQYGCDAGDCVVSSFGLGSSSLDGNGDGIVSPQYEWNRLVLPQLHAAGLVGYGANGTVRIPMLGKNTRLDLEAYLPSSIPGYAYSVALLSALFSAPPFHSLTPNDVLRLDTMLDDGQPQTGRILATGHFGITMIVAPQADYGLSGTPNAGPLNDGTSCITNTSPAAYNNLSTHQPLCTLVYTFGPPTKY